jgi:DNA gyrase subunit B
MEQGHVKYIYSDKEWKEFKINFIEKRKALLESQGVKAADDLCTDDEYLPEYKDIWELQSIDKLARQIESEGLHLVHFGQAHEHPVYRLMNKENKGAFYDLSSTQELLETIREVGKKGATIQRYKGLGEMNPEQLWETTMNIKNRRLLQVTLEDAVETDRIFTTLMGDQVDPRRAFIQTHALDVTNLDI